MGEETWLTIELRLPVDVALVGLPNAGKSSVLNALTGASAPVEPYAQSTREPAFGPLETEDAAHLFLVADLPGLGADGQPRRDGHMDQLERASIVVHLVDAVDPEPAADRMARATGGMDPFLPQGAPVLVVATGCSPEEHPEWSDLAIDTETGEGVEALRARLLSMLGRQ